MQTSFIGTIHDVGAPDTVRGVGKKIFVGRLPQEASAEDLRQYFAKFGRILDVYVPKVNISIVGPFSVQMILLIAADWDMGFFIKSGSEENRPQGLWVCNFC